MKQDFDDATKIVEIIAANKKLTDDNYSKQKVKKVAQSVWNTIKPYIEQNLNTYRNWDKLNYDQRKKFISDILNILVDKFDGNNKKRPKIYFQEDTQKLWPSGMRHPAACCYSPTLSPWAEKYFAKTPLDSSQPFFAFFHDLSILGMLEQVVHEFTHYLQSIGKSSIPYDVVIKAAEYYAYYYADRNKYKQIYADSIHEVEANDVGAHIIQQYLLLIHGGNLVLDERNTHHQVLR